MEAGPRPLQIVMEHVRAATNLGPSFQQHAEQVQHEAALAAAAAAEFVITATSALAAAAAVTVTPSVLYAASPTLLANPDLTEDEDMTGDELVGRRFARTKRKAPSATGSVSDQEVQMDQLLAAQAAVRPTLTPSLDLAMNIRLEKFDSMMSQNTDVMNKMQALLQNGFSEVKRDVTASVSLLVTASEARLESKLDAQISALQAEILEVKEQQKTAGRNLGSPGATSNPMTPPPRAKGAGKGLEPGSPQSHSWNEREGVVYCGGFLDMMPRANIEQTLAEMIRLFGTSCGGRTGVTSSWCPDKFSKSGRIQFDCNENLWTFLKWWKQNGKDSVRFRYGDRFFQTWAAKEKSFGAKQVDRATRELARILTETLKTHIKQEGDLTVMLSRRKVLLRIAPTGPNQAEQQVVVAQAA